MHIAERSSRQLLVPFCFVLLIAAAADAITPNLASNIDRPLRYQPDHADFVIENGTEWFNRPLYGGHSAFRVDAGDKPEFSLYLPGRGGNLRLGLKTPEGAKWFVDSKHIITRYHPGEMLYELHDPMFGAGAIRLAALATAETEGLLIRIDATELPAGSELIWAFGGANGNRGSRSGDIGTEKVPISEFFQYKTEFSRNNKFEISGNTFTLHRQPAPGRIVGTAPQNSQLILGDGRKWNNAAELLASADKTDVPVIVGHSPIESAKPIYLSLQHVFDGNVQSTTLEAPKVADAQETSPAKVELLPPYRISEMPAVFDRTEQYFNQLSQQISVDTPDPFVNSAAGALCIAADGVWDDAAHAFMHGAVAWRTKLLGWRGPYAGDELGWHDRTQEHLDNWFNRQNTSPIDEQVTVEHDTDLTRSEAALHTNGDLSKSHYDMNLVAIDVLFRHLLWTGDREYMKKVWPIVKRHLAWEHRLFRREFGPDHLPLYEAYCCIWASDDVQYDGGGVAYSSAYNFYHNIMAARIAEMLGEDPTPYTHEADLIHQAMEKYLWLSDRGWYGECKDLLGEQRVHPAAGLWSVYHTIDSHVPDPFQAWQMGEYVNTQIAHIPVRGANVPDGCFQLATTSWMPYTWSTNNVVMAETMHTSLAQWQAGQSDQAYAAFKGAILDSMFTGICPGNLGMCTQYDDYRRESQRDFADACGTTSRALVEGLFGITPDCLAGELTIRPGFPADWKHTSIHHADFSFSYKRDGLDEIFLIEPRFAKPLQLHLQCVARAVNIKSITVNDRPAKWNVLADTVGEPRIEIVADPAARWAITIHWSGDRPVAAPPVHITVTGQSIHPDLSPAEVLELKDPQHASNNANAHCTVFAHVHQGDLTWWMPISIDVRPALEILDTTEQDDGHLRFRIRNNTADAIERDLNAKSDGVPAPFHLHVAALSTSDEFVLPSQGFVPGTNAIDIDLGSREHLRGTVTNWKIKADNTRWQSIDLSHAFNDRVTQIYQHKYVSPRSPHCSLSIADDDLGGWCTYATTAEIDDKGLREIAGKNANTFSLPNGVPFSISDRSDANNIAFTSQWDNYPREVNVPLSGSATHAYFLMAGSTNAMQSRFENGEVTVTYTDGTTDRLVLQNPTNWWPIERDYFIDDYAFARPETVPPRVDLKTGLVRIDDLFEGKTRHESIPGGSATVLDLPLDSQKQLKSLTVHATANEVVIGLMGLTLAR